MAPAPCLMVQGTASGVGKSLITTALCRIFARRGLRVAPFKAQNMSLNAAVTADGGEIGRAQATQAEAAGLEPSVDMNPVLLKPEGHDCSQVVVRGVPIGRMTFAEYGRRRDELLAIVAESLARLRASHDVIMIEGAGSPAEINLAEGEIVNMRVARLAQAPVLLVGDIDRGGVFAALVGTLALLEPDDRARVAGLVVNRFRGDPAILGPGLAMLSARTGVPVLGVVPWLDRRLVAAEDSLDLDDDAVAGAEPAMLDIAVVRLPRIANFDDVEPLAREPGVGVRFVRTPAGLAGADLVVLPGSKSTMADLAWLRATGLAAALVSAVTGGTPAIGVCGGYQMLGHTLEDRAGVDGSPGVVAGLGILPAATTFAAAKRTVRVRAGVTAASPLLAPIAGHVVDAYEIHMGHTVTDGSPAPFVVVGPDGEGVDGVVGAAGLVLGTYLHGLFADDGLRRALLGALARRRGVAPDSRWGSPQPATERYDRLAGAVTAALDVAAIARLVGL